MDDGAGFPLARIEMSQGCLYQGITDHWADLDRHLPPPMNDWLCTSFTPPPCKECKWIGGHEALSDLPFIATDPTLVEACLASLHTAMKLPWLADCKCWTLTSVSPVSRPSSNQGSLPHTLHTISMSNTGQESPEEINEINECLTLARQTNPPPPFVFAS